MVLDLFPDGSARVRQSGPRPFSRQLCTDTVVGRVEVVVKFLPMSINQKTTYSINSLKKKSLFLLLYLYAQVMVGLDFDTVPLAPFSHFSIFPGTS